MRHGSFGGSGVQPLDDTFQISTGFAGLRRPFPPEYSLTAAGASMLQSRIKKSIHIAIFLRFICPPDRGIIFPGVDTLHPEKQKNGL
jgi:hypothetical protein